MAPAGIRLTGQERRATTELVYVDAGDLDLQVGDRVVVGTPDGERLGVVRIAPSQVVESALAGPFPPLVRYARPDERPAEESTAGAVLLRSLELPTPGDGPAAGEESGLASGPAAADQERGGRENQGEGTGPD